MEANMQLESLRNAGAVDEGFSFVFRELRKWNAVSIESHAPVLPVDKMVPMLKTIIELRRLMSGQSTENVAVLVRGMPQIPNEIANLNVEDLEALHILQMKASTSRE
jgi:hypothetical protein